MLSSAHLNLAGGSVPPITLETLADRNRLRRAFDEVLARRGMAGTDRVTVQDFAANLEAHIAQLAKELASETYRSLPVLRVLIPEQDKTRPLAVPTVRDRVVQRALADLLQPVLEPYLSPAAFAFRPGKGALAAVKAVMNALEEGHRFVLKADIQRFFEHIDHGLLLTSLGTHVTDPRLLRLILGIVRAQVLDHMTLHDSMVGVHQGSPLSPLLSNLYLLPFDQAVTNAGFLLIRYCDDFVVPCSEPQQARQCLELCRRCLADLRLALHPFKTRLCTPEEPFTFLGFQFLENRAEPSPDAVTFLQSRLGDVAARGGQASELGEVLRGWLQYFGTVPEAVVRTPEGRLACQGAGLPVPVEAEAAPTSPAITDPIATPPLDVTDHRSDQKAPPNPLGTPVDLGPSGPCLLAPDHQERFLYLFSGREDCHAREILDSRGQRRFQVIPRPLAAEDLVDHLAGRCCLGILPLRTNGTIRMLVFNLNARRVPLDADPSEWEARIQATHRHAIEIRQAAATLGLDALVEDSGAKGRHVWLFFQEAVQPAVARRLAAEILQTVKAADWDEVIQCFPDRDRWRPGLEGPILKLPLGIHGRTARRCWLLDDEGRPLPDPGEALLRVQAIPRERLIPWMEDGETSQAGDPAPEGSRPADRREPPWSLNDEAPMAAFPNACRVLAGCAVVRHLYRKARATGWLSHGERLLMLYSLGHLGSESEAAIHQVMSFTMNYNRKVTQRWFESRRDHPISCIRVQESFSGLSAGVVCDCRLRSPRGGYPSPVLHALAASEVDAFRRTAEEQGRQRLKGHPVERAEAERLLGRLAELRRQQRGIEQAIAEVHSLLAALMDATGGDRLDLSSGTLVRERQEGGWSFRMEL